MYLVNAFTDLPFNGNATGVVILNGNLSDDEMQNIAKDLNQSETVFVQRLDVGIYSTRFFTTLREINLCGHATIATFYALCTNEYIQPIENGIIKITQHTKNEKIPVELEYFNGRIKSVHMILKAEVCDFELENYNIAQALNISQNDIGFADKDCVPVKINTGSSDIVIPVKNLEILENLKPDYDKILEISNKENLTSFQVFCMEKDGIVRQRTFSPIIGVKEEAGSGTSTGATLYYINKYYSENIKSIKSVQGIELNRKSSLEAEMIDENKVRVGGRAYVFMNGVLNI